MEEKAVERHFPSKFTFRSWSFPLSNLCNAAASLHKRAFVHLLHGVQANRNAWLAVQAWSPSVVGRPFLQTPLRQTYTFSSPGNALTLGPLSREEGGLSCWVPRGPTFGFCVASRDPRVPTEQSVLPGSLAEPAVSAPPGLAFLHVSIWALLSPIPPPPLISREPCFIPLYPPSFLGSCSLGCWGC